MDAAAHVVVHVRVAVARREPPALRSARPPSRRGHSHPVCESPDMMQPAEVCSVERFGAWSFTPCRTERESAAAHPRHASAPPVYRPRPARRVRHPPLPGPETHPVRPVRAHLPQRRPRPAALVSAHTAQRDARTRIPAACAARRRWRRASPTPPWTAAARSCAPGPTQTTASSRPRAGRTTARPRASGSSPLPPTSTRICRRPVSTHGWHRGHALDAAVRRVRDGLEVKVVVEARADAVLVQAVRPRVRGREKKGQEEDEGLHRGEERKEGKKIEPKGHRERPRGRAFIAIKMMPAKERSSHARRRC